MIFSERGGATAHPVPAVASASVPELEQISDGTRDLLTMRAVLDTLRLHGDGPWNVDELAVLTGRDPASVERVLRGLTADGIGHFS